MIAVIIPSSDKLILNSHSINISTGMFITLLLIIWWISLGKLPYIDFQSSHPSTILLIWDLILEKVLDSKDFKVKFILNDSPLISLKVGADGCHLGQSDMDIEKARKIIKKKIIGVTCHNSLKKAKEAITKKADYIAIGAFHKSTTKKTKYKATLKDFYMLLRLK